MLEWLRVLKVGGRLVIYCPDEQIYAEHCRPYLGPVKRKLLALFRKDG